MVVKLEGAPCEFGFFLWLLMVEIFGLTEKFECFLLFLEFGLSCVSSWSNVLCTISSRCISNILLEHLQLT